MRMTCQKWARKCDSREAIFFTLVLILGRLRKLFSFVHLPRPEVLLNEHGSPLLILPLLEVLDVRLFLPALPVGGDNDLRVPERHQPLPDCKPAKRLLDEGGEVVDAGATVLLEDLSLK
jgi:hypothetical protein